MRIISFIEALKESDTYSKRHLLLGNGFSIACRPDIFVYQKLFEQADFSRLSPSVRAAFEVLNTTDFERVIKALRDLAVLIQVYGIDKTIADQMMSDSNQLKELLVRTIAKTHPERPSDISDKEYEACQRFLNNFASVYTMNYDLLLYWTKMHETSRRGDDGFRTAEDDILTGFESDYVVWEPSQSHEQNMWFLHGALHIFDSGTEIRKFTWARTGIRLIEQTRDALNRNFFPLFVAEGTSKEKFERVRHSDYLAKAYRSFEEIRYCLFIYGHSLSPNDEHYLHLIEKGHLRHIYVGLHGDSTSDSNRQIIRRAEQMRNVRGTRRPLDVTFFDSASAQVWGR